MDNRHERNVNISEGSPVLRFLKLAVIVGACSVVLYFAAASIIDVAAPHVPFYVEEKMAGMFMKGVPGAKTRTERERVLQALVDRLKACAKLSYPVTVHITDDDLVNAFALPGGNVLVTEGLLKAMNSENELAFVLCHEMGHISARDNLRGLGRRVLLGFTNLLFGSHDSGSSDTSPLHFTELALTRKQEKAADRYALRALNCAYGHVGGATDFFATMAKKHDKPAWHQYASTHPDSRLRVKILNNLAKKWGYSSGPLLPVPSLRKKSGDQSAEQEI